MAGVYRIMVSSVRNLSRSERALRQEVVELTISSRSATASFGDFAPGYHDESKMPANTRGAPGCGKERDPDQDQELPEMNLLGAYGPLEGRRADPSRRCALYAEREAIGAAM